MARQAIKQLLSKFYGNSDQLYRILVKTRDHLLHGRSPDLVEAEIGESMERSLIQRELLRGTRFGVRCRALISTSL